jgi:hypothetical protein
VGDLERMASAAAVGMMGGNGGAVSSSSWFQIKNRRKKNNKDNMGRDRVRIFCASSYSSSSSSVMDPYKTLKIQPGASESEVKKAFRQLALQVQYIFLFLLLEFLGGFLFLNCFLLCSWLVS